MARLIKSAKKWVTRGSKSHSTYSIACRLYLRAMGVISLLAFASYWYQMPGLIGSKGVAPARLFFDAVRRQLDLADAVLALPSLAWFNTSDVVLHSICGAGIVCSLLLLLNVVPRLAAFFVWLLYLSLANADHVFLSFQWDSLFIEMAFLTLFISPRRSFLFRWLLFKVVFSSGVVKLSSHDPNWRNLTALLYHYETQPLPTVLGWYAHHLVPFIQKMSTAVMFGIELFVPFFIFASRPLRILAFYALASLQIAIQLTGNYGFFNLLTLTLSLFLLDDKTLRLLPVRKYAPRESGLRRWSILIATVVFVAIGLIEVGYAFFRENLPAPAYDVMALVEPLRTINPYGLFATMTTERREIVLSGSDDGKKWREYEFRWKPGDLKLAPKSVAPYMPRLDWQMWFAALGDIQSNDWLQLMMQRLLEGTPEVLALLRNNPFPNHPPRFVRAMSYHYEFTTLEEKMRTGDWWHRTDETVYARPVSR